METEAAVLFGTNALKLERLSTPALKRGQVLVQIAYSGICRSQLLEIRGKRGEDKFLPHTLGHEGSGIVIEVGDGVKKVKPGDHVILSWIKGEGLDVPSATYFRKSVAINSGAISTFMSHAVVSENRLVAISEKMPLREAALLGCMIPTGAGIVFHLMPEAAKASLAVFGAGGVGLSATLAAKILGVNPIIVIDLHEDRLKLARSIGATHVFNASQGGHVIDVIREVAGNSGVDFSIESAGNQNAMEAAFKSVRTGGGLCILAGNLPHGEKISIDPFDLILGRRLVGTWGGGTNPDTDIHRYCDFYLAGQMELAPLIAKEYKLEQIHDALNDLEHGVPGRGLIQF